jgi:hypothetical protein
MEGRDNRERSDGFCASGGTTRTSLVHCEYSTLQAGRLRTQHMCYQDSSGFPIPRQDCIRAPWDPGHRFGHPGNAVLSTFTRVGFRVALINVDKPLRTYCGVERHPSVTQRRCRYHECHTEGGRRSSAHPQKQSDPQEEITFLREARKIIEKNFVNNGSWSWVYVPESRQYPRDDQKASISSWPTFGA